MALTRHTPHSRAQIEVAALRQETPVASIDEIVSELKQGRMVVLVDEERTVRGLDK